MLLKLLWLQLWIYNVLFYSNDSVITDSCIVEMEITKKNFVSFLMSQKGVSYFYEIDGIKYHEKTGVKETEEGISLHQPRLGAFDFTEVLNMPTITYPLGVFITRKVKTEVTKSTFKPAENKVIMQEESQEKTENLLINGENLLCYRIEGKNSNYIEELGQYRSIFWFNETYGFVKLTYIKPDGSIVDFTMINTNF